MPGLTGFELARRIDKVDKDKKIVLMTAFEITKEELEKVFPSIRVHAFIRKPIGIVKLMYHLHVLLGIHSHKGRRDSLVLHL